MSEIQLVRAERVAGVMALVEITSISTLFLSANFDSEVKNLVALFHLTTDQLMQISDFLEISGTNREKIVVKTRYAFVTHIINVENVELSELKDEGILSLMDHVKALQDTNKNEMPEKG